MSRAIGIMVCCTLWLAGLETKADVSTSELPVLTGTKIHRLKSSAVGDSFVLYVRVPPAAAASSNS